MEYYSVTKKNEIMPLSATWTQQDYRTKWSKSERERQIPNGITYIWNLKYVANDGIYEQKQTHQQRKQTYGSQKEKEVGRNKLAIEN